MKISWNGAAKDTQEKVMLGSNWERVLENVREFIAVRDEHAALGGNRCRVTFQLTFMEINYAELPQVVELAAGLGVDRVKGHHLWAHFSQIKEPVNAPHPRGHRPVERHGGRGIRICGKIPAAQRRQGAAG